MAVDPDAGAASWTVGGRAARSTMTGRIGTISPEVAIVTQSHR
jgi:hypothetical protein